MSHGMSEEIKRLHRLLDRKESGVDEQIITNEKVIADLRNELEAFNASSDIRGAEVERLRAENAALRAANRDCLTHFEDIRQDYNGLTHFVADLRSVFSLNECGFTELMNAAIEAKEDAVRLDWLCTLTQQRLTRIRKAFVRRGPGAAVLDADCGDIRAAIDAERKAA